MTLTDLLPTLRASLRMPLGSGVWPASARWAEQGELLVDGVRMTALAAAHGTPVHVLSESQVRARCAEYAATFGVDAVSYSAKAGLTVGSGRWMASEGLGCYAGSADALRTALLAGFPAAGLVLHGDSKSLTDLDAAFECGAAIVAGSLAEVHALASRAPAGQRVHLRVVASTPDLHRHRYGLRLGSRAALAAARAVAAAPNLVPAGLDCSIGHQLSRFHAFEACVREAVGFAARLGATVPAINLGGGHAVAYTDRDDGFALAAFAPRIRAMLRLAADLNGIPAPRLTVSPGRAIVARAGLTLHRVAVVSAAPDGTPLVTLDGGVPDCATDPVCAGRHALELVGRVSYARIVPMLVDGPEPVPRDLPADLVPGDLVAMAGTGAYHHRPDLFTGRPAVIAVADGATTTLIHRETVDDLLHRVG